MTLPLLSIVIPTREGFSEHWLEELLKLRGDIEFILVHPPGASKSVVEDSRMKQIISPIRGEIIQRINGLLNASAPYILTINCDEYLIPDVLEITVQYFQRFPDSWVMRLSKKGFDFDDKVNLDSHWLGIPKIEQMKVCSKSQGNQKCYGEPDYLLEIPIAPLTNKFDLRCLILRRKDHHGTHTENFDKKVWKTPIVQESLQDIVKLMDFFGPFKYIPFWCLDRLLGLFIQAKFFQEGKTIGHLLPLPEQIRCEDNPPEYTRKNRFYVLAEIFLIRKFPQYGYFWNLIIDGLKDFPLAIKRGIFNSKKPDLIET